MIFHWTYREWGGAQIYFIGIMKMARADWDILVVIPKQSSAEIVKFLDEIGVKYEFTDTYLDLDPAPTIGRKLNRHWSRIRSEIASYRFLRRFDLHECILHIEISPWVSWIFLAALSMRRANIFVTLHNALPNFPAWRVMLWKTRMQFVSRLPGFHIFTSNKHAKKSFKGWVEHKFWEDIRVTYTTANPAEVEDALKSEFDRNAARRELNIGEQQFVVLCVGQFIDRKGRWTFLEAAKLALESDPDLQFVWVSPSLPSPEETKRIEAYGIESNFRVVLSSSIGSTRHDILSFFRITDIFALPSFVEGLPIALLEAMAMGIPSISTNITAIPEAIIDGETGILIDAGDGGGLADRILSLKADPELRQRLSRAGRKFVLDHFDEREASRIAIEAYKECFSDVE
ncbi:MAG TPA: glycosyltransferase family 4 protein [Pyrinomonadaceae bacterium]|nr:glycosyltransferase family 4 protein [Pyrinomonadaceae bacterium]